jgi:hypothetical protein
MTTPVLARIACVTALLSVAVAGATAQSPKPSDDQHHAAAADPRVGLKAGLRDAGIAERNMTLVVNVPKPAGFYDPDSPAGAVTPPESETPAGGAQPAAPSTPPAPAGRGGPFGLNFANSDLAFSGDRLFAGNFNGFNAYDIKDPRKPKLIASVVCPGGQGDVSVYGHLLFMSVEQTRGRIDCGTNGVETPVSAERFRGVRVFDITDVSKPKQVAAVQTCRGSHTHTLVTDPNDKENVYIYGSGTSSVRSAEELAGCSGQEPKEDPNTSLFSIDVIQVPLASPEKARIVSRPRIFADPNTGAISGLWQGGDYGPGTQTSRVTNQCHDITVFPEVGLAAGACSGNGILLDISHPANPVRLDAVSDKNFAYWHSATFNNDGTKVVFTDEWGGGLRPRCRATDLPNWGADALFGIAEKKMQFQGYYKMPAAQSDTENCVAHNGSLVPVPGRDIMVQGWYQGGVSVFDFTDPAHPVEIAFFDRGPIDAKNLITGGIWSAYWYNGYIYGTEIARGLDVYRLTPSDLLSQNEIEAATLARSAEFNPQHQTKVSWPATGVVARAYLDQLSRSKAVTTQRAGEVTSVFGKADKIKAGGKDADVERALTDLAASLEGDAAKASGPDQTRLRALAELLKTRASSLH